MLLACIPASEQGTRILSVTRTPSSRSSIRSMRLDHTCFGIGFVFQSAARSGGRFDSGPYIGRLDLRTLKHLQHPGAIAEDVLRGNRHRPPDLVCSESPAFSVIARGTVNQASRYVVTLPPPRFCERIRLLS
jgi:hypothetical protein